MVIGGGDSAMEDALVLSRTSKSVTVIHRRDSFRASYTLAQRVLENPKISVQWNKTVVSFNGGEAEGHNPAMLQKVVVKDVASGEASDIACNAAFVAIGAHPPCACVSYSGRSSYLYPRRELTGIACRCCAAGHIPNTQLFTDSLEMDDQGYLKVQSGSTRTSVEGVFAAGDVADKVYRQAITSSGSGAMAALDAERWLSEKGLGVDDTASGGEEGDAVMADATPLPEEAPEADDLMAELLAE
eukprot:COSAG05_NODE_6947_length_876_cov_1.277992_1_plen_242_part_10